MNRPGYGINNQRRNIVFKYYHLRYYRKINRGAIIPLLIWLTWKQVERQRTERKNRWRRNNGS